MRRLLATIDAPIWLLCRHGFTREFAAPMRSNNRDHWGDATRAIHSGEEKHGISAPITTPIARSRPSPFPARRR